MTRRDRVTSLWLLLLFMTACAGQAPPPRGLLGAYRLEDGRIVSIRPSEENTLRYREFESAASGRLYPLSARRYEAGDGFTNREPVAVTVDFQVDSAGLAGGLRWTTADGTSLSASRIGKERWVRFESDSVSLSGRLHVPEGSPPYPAIVLVHGSGDTPGSDWFYDGDFLVAHGFAILAYDKRGTGGSGGDFTFDFHQLARDAAAAVGYLRSQPMIDGDRIGLSGYSQGGWVAPLAATLTDVRFVLVSYGMIESPAEEARMEMLHLLDKGGVEAAELPRADSLVTAAIALVASRFKEGWEPFNVLRRRYRRAPWLRYLDGTPVDQLVSYPNWAVRLLGPRKLPKGLPWHYESTALLDTLAVPMVWFLGGEDESAPNEQTIPKLRALEASGRPLELRVFREADHGMLLFREEDGHRVYTGYAPGYFKAEVEAAMRLASLPRPAVR